MRHLRLGGKNGGKRIGKKEGEKKEKTRALSPGRPSSQRLPAGSGHQPASLVICSRARSLCGFTALVEIRCRGPSPCDRETGRQSERERGRDTERERERHTQRKTERQSKREGDRDTERERERDRTTARQNERKGDRDTEREERADTDREKERERGREGERGEYISVRLQHTCSDRELLLITQRDRQSRQHVKQTENEKQAASIKTSETGELEVWGDVVF